MIKKKNILES